MVLFNFYNFYRFIQGLRFRTFFPLKYDIVRTEQRWQSKRND